MADANPTDLESLISRLRASGVPEEEIEAQVAEVTFPANARHTCISCKRSSGPHAISIEIDGEVAYKSPSRWVYCYRERNVPLGLCDQCFHRGRFDGFTPDEIAYFRESFEQIDELDDD